MPPRLILDENPEFGITTTWEEDGEGRETIVSWQDMDPHLKHNHDVREAGTDGFTESRQLHLKARVPTTVYDSWLREAMTLKIPLYDKEALRKFVRGKLAQNQRFVIGRRASGRVGYGD